MVQASYGCELPIKKRDSPAWSLEGSPFQARSLGQIHSSTFFWVKQEQYAIRNIRNTRNYTIVLRNHVLIHYCCYKEQFRNMLASKTTGKGNIKQCHWLSAASNVGFLFVSFLLQQILDHQDRDCEEPIEGS